MSAEHPVATQSTDERPSDGPARKPFIRRRIAVRMSPEAAARQGRVTGLAWDALRDRNAVVDFLNTHDGELGGRPIDLAIADPSGLAAVERVLADRSVSVDDQLQRNR